ncbi:hypothetical protein GCM10009759_08960 [Kitasatospora saccharophila]|uniref:Uncharacterized protein n=1 Tax=Kitasatospora saccharophila TaxID=407973 RepID=A0ABN2W9W8_9ACTN
MRGRIDRIAEPWGDRTPYGPGQPWPARRDSHLTGSGVDRWVPAASLLHSNGDAMDVAVRDGRIVGVRGRTDDRTKQPLDAHGPGAIGFHTSGQLFPEEYHTLAVIARAGIDTNHLDGSTRLCTATAAEALKETFGCDGQPASHTDVDHCDTFALFGRNMAETQPVLWMRVPDRLAGPEPPRLLCVEKRTPAWAARICDVPAREIRRAAELLGDARRLLSTVLQGVYQSRQATAAVQVDNLQLLRGMLGRPGCGVLQMNGQPTAENTRECGADGDLPGFRNWQNAAHVAELADQRPDPAPEATP